MTTTDPTQVIPVVESSALDDDAITSEAEAAAEIADARAAAGPDPGSGDPRGSRRELLVR